MAEPPPPQPPLMKAHQSESKQGSRLPPTSRFPVLVSGQVSFTTAAAIKDLEQVPQNVYRIQVELQPRTSDSTFKEAPWTLVARHFLSTIQLYDDTAIIIRKKDNAMANKISGPEELPENPEIFERDYAYDVKLKSEKSVTFKIMIGTKKNYWKTFREGQLYKKMVANEWYTKYVRLENQGTVAAIGHLIYAHNRFVNQEDIISEIRNLIYPTHCEQIDVRVTKSKEYYYEGKKKMRVFTKWITIDCPMDIANDLSNLIMERWSLLQTDPKFENYNIKNTVYVPRNRGLVNFDSRIENIAKQNEFLRNYRDVTVLTNIHNIDATFTYTKSMGILFGDDSQVGHHLKLREFIKSWKDQTTGKSAIIAIYRTNNEREYSLLSGHINMESIHRKIRLFVEELNGQLGFQKVRVGGTKGTNNTNNYSTNIKKYAKENFSTQKRFEQRPQQEPTSSKEEQEKTEKNNEENQWKYPPMNNRRQKKGVKPSLTVNYNDQRLIQDYKDVVVGNAYNNNQQGIYSGQNNTVPILGNNNGAAKAAIDNNTVILQEEHQQGEITQNGRGMINQMTLLKILESKQFQATLAKAVAPQVSQQVTSLVAPTLKKIAQIESQVGELHEYVQGNTKWQEVQTHRQSNLQNSMNQMQATMNSMIDLFKGQIGTDTGNKRPAPKVTQEIPESPTRRQKKSTMTTQSNKTNHKYNNQNYNNNFDEACNPHQSQLETFTEEYAEEADLPMDVLAEGEGQ